MNDIVYDAYTASNDKNKALEMVLSLDRVLSNDQLQNDFLTDDAIFILAKSYQEVLVAILQNPKLAHYLSGFQIAELMNSYQMVRLPEFSNFAVDKLTAFHALNDYVAIEDKDIDITRFKLLYLQAGMTSDELTTMLIDKLWLAQVVIKDSKLLNFSDVFLIMQRHKEFAIEILRSKSREAIFHQNYLTSDQIYLLATSNEQIFKLILENEQMITRLNGQQLDNLIKRYSLPRSQAMAFDSVVTAYLELMSHCDSTSEEFDANSIERLISAANLDDSALYELAQKHRVIGLACILNQALWQRRDKNYFYPAIADILEQHPDVINVFVTTGRLAEYPAQEYGVDLVISAAIKNVAVEIWITWLTQHPYIIAYVTGHNLFRLISRHVSAISAFINNHPVLQNKLSDYFLAEYSEHAQNVLPNSAEYFFCLGRYFHKEDPIKNAKVAFWYFQLAMTQGSALAERKLVSLLNKNFDITGVIFLVEHYAKTKNITECDRWKKTALSRGIGVYIEAVYEIIEQHYQQDINYQLCEDSSFMWMGNLTTDKFLPIAQRTAVYLKIIDCYFLTNNLKDADRYLQELENMIATDNREPVEMRNAAYIQLMQFYHLQNNHEKFEFYCEKLTQLTPAQSAEVGNILLLAAASREAIVKVLPYFLAAAEKGDAQIEMLIIQLLKELLRKDLTAYRAEDSTIIRAQALHELTTEFPELGDLILGSMSEKFIANNLANHKFISSIVSYLCTLADDNFKYTALSGNINGLFLLANEGLALRFLTTGKLHQHTNDNSLLYNLCKQHVFVFGAVRTDPHLLSQLSGQQLDDLQNKYDPQFFSDECQHTINAYQELLVCDTSKDDIEEKLAKLNQLLTDANLQTTELQELAANNLTIRLLTVLRYTEFSIKWSFKQLSELISKYPQFLPAIMRCLITLPEQSDGNNKLYYELRTINLLFNISDYRIFQKYSNSDLENELFRDIRGLYSIQISGIFCLSYRPFEENIKLLESIKTARPEIVTSEESSEAFASIRRHIYKSLVQEVNDTIKSRRGALGFHAANELLEKAKHDPIFKSGKRGFSIFRTPVIPEEKLIIQLQQKIINEIEQLETTVKPESSTNSQLIKKR